MDHGHLYTVSIDYLKHGIDNLLKACKLDKALNPVATGVDLPVGDQKVSFLSYYLILKIDLVDQVSCCHHYYCVHSYRMYNTKN